MSRRTSEDPGQPHDELDNAFQEQKRRNKREDCTTPAMRMYLAKVPVALETIPNTDWHVKLATSQRYKARTKEPRTRRPAPRPPRAEPRQPAA